jgi:hypothetical protein
MSGDQMRRRFVLFVTSAVLAASVSAPAFGSPVKSFAMKLGSTLTIKGHTGSATSTTPAVGKVVVSGRWGTGPWRVLTTTTTDDAGRYRFTLKPQRRGNLALTIRTPDHQPQRYVLHVT